MDLTDNIPSFAPRGRVQRDPISKETIEKVQLNVLRGNEFEMVETDRRNVLFVGKTRSGKTTCYQVMKNPCYCPHEFSIFSDTAEARFQSFGIKNNANGNHVKYTIGVIDTPGLFEVKAEEEVNYARQNEQIVQVISKCLENEVTTLNCVIIFASFVTGVNTEDVESIKTFAKLFASSEKNKNKLAMALVVTRAEDSDLAWQNKIVSELKKHVEISKIIEETKMKIFFMGCVNTNERTYYGAQDLMENYEKVYNMRSELLEFIISSDQTKMLVELDLMVLEKPAISKCLDEVLTSYHTLQDITDFTHTQGAQAAAAIIHHKLLLKKLAKYKGYLMMSAELGPRVANIFTLSKAIAEREDIPEKIRSSLLWPPVRDTSDDNSSIISSSSTSSTLSSPTPSPASTPASTKQLQSR